MRLKMPKSKILEEVWIDTRYWIYNNELKYNILSLVIDQITISSRTGVINNRETSILILAWASWKKDCGDIIKIQTCVCVSCVEFILSISIYIATSQYIYLFIVIYCYLVYLFKSRI